MQYEAHSSCMSCQGMRLPLWLTSATTASARPEAVSPTWGPPGVGVVTIELMQPRLARWEKRTISKNSLLLQFTVYE